MATQPRSKIQPITPTPTAPMPQALEDRIRARAYQLYEERGRLEGHALEDWLKAETELLPPLASRA